MIQIYPDHYQFTITIPQMNFTIHQYLLDAKDPILAATGTTWCRARDFPCGVLSIRPRCICNAVWPFGGDAKHFLQQ